MKCDKNMTIQGGGGLSLELWAGHMNHHLHCPTVYRWRCTSLEGDLKK